MVILPLGIEKVTAICRENDIQMLGVFGSFARGDHSEKSDLDLLVRFTKRKSLLSVLALERELSELAGREVDLLTEAAISPLLRNRILNDLEVIYEA